MEKKKLLKKYFLDNEPFENGIHFDSILLLLTLFSSIVVFYLDRNMNFHSLIKIIVDLLVMIIVLKLSYYFLKKKIKLIIPTYLVLAFILIGIIGYFINGYSIIKFATVFEFDYFRFLIVYLGVIYFDISNESIIKTFKCLNIFLLLQIPIILIQFIRLKPYFGRYEYGIVQDYLSGLLGGKSTAELGAYICIAIITSYVLFRYKKMKLKTFALSSIALLFIVVLSEIKFVLLVLPILLAITYVKGTGKKQTIIVGSGIIILVIGMYFTGKIYPEFKDILTADKMKEYLEYNYAESNLSRLNSISVANEVISEKIPTKMFGMGIGNTNNTGNNLSEFASNNIYLFKMFTWSYILAETGYLGIITIIIIYGLNIYYSIKLVKSKSEFNEIIGTIGIPSIILFVILNFYCMAMTKLNFAILAWMGLGLISKLYFKENKSYYIGG